MADLPVADLILRPATAADAPAIVGVHLAARKAAPMPTSAHSDAEVARWLTGRIGGIDGDEVWVAQLGGRIDEPVVGYARFTRTWLDDLYVSPTHARHGAGSALLELVKARLSGGFGLWVFASNEPARSFYRRHGLVEVEATDGSGNEERAPDVRLAWPAPPNQPPR